MTPETRIMIPWHPVPGDIPPAGCTYNWSDSAPGTCGLWNPWPDLAERMTSMGMEYDPAVSPSHLREYAFQIPLPPEYAVVIIDDTTLRDAQAICDVLSIGAMYDTVAAAYANYVANRVGDYEDQHHAI